MSSPTSANPAGYIQPPPPPGCRINDSCNCSASYDNDHLIIEVDNPICLGGGFIEANSTEGQILENVTAGTCTLRYTVIVDGEEIIYCYGNTLPNTTVTSDTGISNNSNSTTIVVNGDDYDDDDDITTHKSNVVLIGTKLYIVSIYGCILIFVLSCVIFLLFVCIQQQKDRKFQRIRNDKPTRKRTRTAIL